MSNSDTGDRQYVGNMLGIDVVSDPETKDPYLRDKLASDPTPPTRTVGSSVLGCGICHLAIPDPDKLLVHMAGHEIERVSAPPSDAGDKPCPFCEGRGGNRDYRRGKPDGIMCEHCGGTGKAKPGYYDTPIQSKAFELEEELYGASLVVTNTKAEASVWREKMRGFIAQRERAAIERAIALINNAPDSSNYVDYDEERAILTELTKEIRNV